MPFQILTAADDDARLLPIGSLPTSATLSVTVTFSDGTSRDMTSDDRVTYTTSDTGCGVANDASNSISVPAGAKAAGCTSVVVVAAVALGSTVFYTNTTVPIDYLQSLAVSCTKPF